LAVARGVTVIEKHLTLWRSDGGPDAAFSMEPGEFRKMVAMVRRAEKAMEPQYGDPPLQFVKSLYVVADIAPGEQFTDENVRAIRPGYGLHPRELHKVLGQKAARACTRGERMTWEMVT
jgi:sialic acid synthase SpsE